MSVQGGEKQSLTLSPAVPTFKSQERGGGSNKGDQKRSGGDEVEQQVNGILCQRRDCLRKESVFDHVEHH